MSYNLRFGQLASMDSIANFISEKNPDLVALQECDWATYRENALRQNGVRFINVLAYDTGMFGLFARTINYKKGYYGIGILSKYPIIRSERKLLPNSRNGGEPRAMLICEVELPSGQRLTFVCTHLTVKSSELRERQLAFINKTLAHISGPVIIAGDMNSKPDSKEIQKGFEGWTQLTDMSTKTFSSTEPRVKIDYIAGKPKGIFSLISTEVCSDVMLSDHLPVISRISF
jgi:endonuclease/exonuclease/phosphatase family metal-dependent hydrolase